MGLIKIAKEMTDSERIAILNSNMQFLELSSRLRKYPLGMIVGFDTDIDPNEAYGGVWERIKGRFIWGVDDNETVGVTGGEKTHALTVAELAAHRHGKIYYADSGKTFGLADTGTSPTSAWALEYAGADNHPGDSLNTGETGGGEPHNNMPPYYAVYLWRKTANAAGEDPTVTEYEIITKETSAAIEQAKKDVTDITNTACSNALRGSVSGSAVRMDDVSPNEHTLGVKASSKNLIPYPFAVAPSVVSGITFTDNGDGTVTASGTATAAVIFAPYTASAYFEVEPGTYTYSDELSADSGITYWSEVRTTKDDTILVRSYDANKTFTIAKKTALRLNLRIVNGQTVNNLVFKPHLELGSTATAYTPYVSDLASVSVTRCGKNLIQFPYIPLTAEKTVAGITYTPLSDGGIKLNGTATAISSVVFYNNTSQGAVPITLKANLTYMASTGLSSKIGVYIRPFKPSGNSHVAITDVFTTRTITLTEDATVDQILVVVASGTTVNNVVVYPQIELGSAATGYELYDGQTYTPAADGTVENVKSLCPTSMLTTDTSGVVISTEYNKDINKAFAELQQAIISLGGNV